MNLVHRRVFQSKFFIIMFCLNVLLSHVGYAYGQDPRWLKILHMKKTGWDAWQSDVISPGFFLSKAGQRNPDREWAEALSVFNSPYEGDPNLHPQCRFPARARLLRHLTHARWPIPKCPALEAWKSKLNPRSVTIVHAAAYMGDPASVFGHIFLRIDVSAPDHPFLKLDTLATSVGFFAHIPENTSSIDYLLKGLFGGFLGRFVIDSYGQSLMTYNHIENRELWELELSLTDLEIDHLLDHLWELHHNGAFDYRFLEANCAYQLLALLDTVRDDLKMADSFSLYVIPGDAVLKALKAKLVRHVTRRTSPGSKLKKAWSQMGVEQRNQTSDLLAHRLAPHQTDDPRIIDTALGLMEYRTHQEKGAVPNGWGTLRKGLLSQRAQLPSPMEDIKGEDLDPEPTQRFMAPARLSLGLTKDPWTQGLLIGLRPAMHSSLDPGFADMGLSLELLAVRFLIPAGQKKWLLDQFTLFNVENLPDFDTIDFAPAWRVRLALERALHLGDGEALHVRFVPEIGLATETNYSVRGFALVTMPFETLSPSGQSVQMGLGFTTGIHANITPRYQGRAESTQYLSLREDGSSAFFRIGKIDLQATLTSDMSIGLSYATTWGQQRLDLLWNWYF
jgi:hypothetical protein